MPPLEDWQKTQESEIERTRKGLHDLRNVVNSMQLNNQDNLNKQTADLTQKITSVRDEMKDQITSQSKELRGEMNKNHLDTVEKVGELKLSFDQRMGEMSDAITTIKVKFGVYIAIVGFLCAIVAPVIAALIIRATLPR